MRGYLEERRPGVWRYRLSRGRVAGKYREHSATFRADGVRDARKRATQLAAKWDRDDATAVAHAGTVGGLLDEWIKFRAGDGESPSTPYRRGSVERAIREGLGHIRLADLTTFDIDRWVMGLADRAPSGRARRPIQPVTARHYLRILSAVLNQGEKWGKLERNPARRARVPKFTKQDQAPHMPTVDAWRVLVGAASPSVRMALVLAACTGARRGELVGLRWSDVDGDGMLTIERSVVKVPGAPPVVKLPKSGKMRRLRLPQYALDALFVYSAWQMPQMSIVELPRDGPILADILADPSGRTHRSPEWLTAQWNRLCRQVGLPGLKLHGLRHLHASLLVEAGVSLAGVQDRQGHAALSTTIDFYVHPNPDADDAAADVLDRIFRPLAAIEQGASS